MAKILFGCGFNCGFFPMRIAFLDVNVGLQIPAIGDVNVGDVC